MSMKKKNNVINFPKKYTGKRKVKLPNKDVISALDISSKILSSDNFEKIKIIDLRVSNQIIINE